MGCLVLAGWALDLAALKRIAPSLPDMKAHTALAFVAAGAALVLLRGTPGRSARLAGRTAGGLVGAFGLVVVGEYLFGNLGIDTLLFADGGRHPGRPSPHTGVAFAVAGTALATVDLPGETARRAHALATGAFGAVVLAAVVGYVYGVDYLRGRSDATGMALHTAATLAVVWVGIVGLRPDRGFLRLLRSDRPSRILIRQLGAVAVVAPLALGVLQLEGERSGLFTPTFGLALLTLGTIAAALAFIGRAGRALDVADADRQGAEGRFRILVESAQDAMVIVNSEGEIALVNEGAEALFGYERTELVGQPVDMLVPVQFRDAHAARRAHYLRSPTRRRMSGTVELSARHRDGHEIPVEISLAPIHMDGSLHVAAGIRDVSERRRALEVQRRLAAIVEHTDDAILAQTTDGRITDWNRGAERLYGYSAAEALGGHVGMLVPPELAADEQEMLRHVFAGGKVKQHETERIAKDGRRLDVSLTVSPIRNDRGDIVATSTIARDISERKRFEGQLQYLADHDALTGLYNRRRFEEEVDRELARARRFGRGGAVLVLDIDHFKYVNDSLGHAAGDELIARIADALRHRLRATDVIGRLGGDEFAVIMPDVDMAAARLVAEGLLAATRSVAEPGARSWSSRVTASIGIAPFSDPGTLSGQDLLVQADIAMYDAKEAGRDQVSLYDVAAHPHSPMRSRLSWADRTRAALAEDRLVLHAQPIVPLGAEEGPMYELLVRMVGEDGELIPPAAFLTIAERFDLIGEIDRWVLRAAIRLLGHEQALRNDIRLSVNISARSIGDADLLALVARELAAADADPRGLCIEVTETAAIVNIAAAQDFALQLREMGCGFALDDFGAGFASFYYLKHLPFDFLKIDGEFIRHLPDNPANELIVKSIVGIARTLGKRTVAEYVEDEETVVLLREYGVDYAQGFYTGRPRPLGASELAGSKFH